MTWQARAITDPIKNPLIGWHLEYYWFYVQLSDIISDLSFLYNPGVPGSETVQEVATRLELYQVASTPVNAVEGEQADFLYLSYKRIVEEFFRDENEPWLDAGNSSGALAVARTNRKTWADSAVGQGQLDAMVPEVIVGVDDKFTALEVKKMMAAYELEMAAGLTDMTFDDYLASQGIGEFSDARLAKRPELLRFRKEWQYPSNTVEPTTGVPSSAVSWAVSGRADKDRFFKEPGFVLGVTIARPKLYYSDQKGSIVGFMNNPMKWFPQQLMNERETGFHKFTVANPILGNTIDLAFDLRDLLHFGEQFLNFDPAGTYAYNKARFVTSANAASMGWVQTYPTPADMNALFVGASPNNNVRQDGVVEFRIATYLPPDPTPGSDAMDTAAMDTADAETGEVPLEASEDDRAADLAEAYRLINEQRARQTRSAARRRPFNRPR